MRPIHQDNQITLLKYVVHLMTLIIGALLLFELLANQNKVEGFIYETVAFLILSIIATILFTKDIKLAKFIVMIYLFKIVIGVLHYIYFIDPSYFSNSTNSIKLHHEYEAVYQFIKLSVDAKSQNNIFYTSMINYVTHEELLSHISIPFSYFGVHVLNIAPINSFFSLFAALNIYILNRYHFKLNHNIVRSSFIVMALFPTTLISSLFFRDTVGWALISIGIVIITLSKNHLSLIISSVCACYLFYLQRNAYSIMPIAILLYKIIKWHKMGKKSYIFLYIILCAVAISFILTFFFNHDTSQYIENSYKWPIYLIPIKIFVGLVGPFPWSNFLEWHKKIEVSYYLQDYLCGILNIALLLIFLTKRKVLLKWKYITEVEVTGFILLLFGIMNNYMHITYISVGIFFLIPWFFKSVSNHYFRQTIKYSFILLVILNMIVGIMGITGIGQLVK